MEVTKRSQRARAQSESRVEVEPRRYTSVEEVYGSAEGRRYAGLRECKESEADVAALVQRWSVVLSEDVLAFETSTDRFDVYVATGSGVWERQAGQATLMAEIGSVRDRVGRFVLSPLRDAYAYVKGRADADSGEGEPSVWKVKQALLAREIKHVDAVDTKLATTAFKKAVLLHILHRTVLTTKAAGVTPEALDARRDCIAFVDGVFDFTTSRFVSGAEAKEYYQTMTVGYAYQDLRELEPSLLEEFDSFLSRVHRDERNRTYLLAKLRSAARRKNEQILLVHYNTAGSNGKSTLFSIIKRAFGSLYMTCAPALLASQGGRESASGPNEELYSVKGASVVLFAEPSGRRPLSSAFIKRLTGDDEQSARRNFGHKETFTFSGLPNLLCNRIPQLDEMDGGISRRLRCLPYGTRFVEAGDPAIDEVTVFARDETLRQRVGSLGMCLMRRILEVDPDSERRPDPPDVMDHTRTLIERESVTARFVEERLRRTESREDVVRLKDAWQVYKEYATTQSLQDQRLGYAAFAEHLEEMLGRCVAKSGAMRSFWRGWRIVNADSASDVADSE